MIPLPFIIFIFGAVFGSFLNVLISRIPKGESIINPPSHCPFCGRKIRFYDNIPIISYLILKGKCRDCGKQIPLRYLWVELITAFLALLLFYKFGFFPQFLISFLFSCSMIVIAVIDYDYQIIPDVITLPGMVIFSALSIFFMGVSLRDALLGILFGGGILLSLYYGYKLLTKREGMGGGDIKMLAMIGGFFGWQSLFFIVLFSSFVGTVVGLSIILLRKRDMKYAIPFGPFLSLAAISQLFVGDAFLRFLFLW